MRRFEEGREEPEEGWLFCNTGSGNHSRRRRGKEECRRRE